MKASNSPKGSPRKRRRAAARSTEPFADRIPRPAKRVAGRTAAQDVPANIRVAGVNLDDEDREWVRKRLGARLGKFAPLIERVSVRATDDNGPKGGVDQVIRIKVVVSRQPSVVFESRSSDFRMAANRALAGVERAMQRGVQRRRPA